jgi:hypothetical protein
MNRASPLLALILASGCMRPAPLQVAQPASEPEPPAAVAPAAEIVAGTSVWNRDAGVLLRGATEMLPLPHVFMRLEVMEAEGAELRVRCVHCPLLREGWIGRDAVVHAPAPPARAAGGELAEFALALRDAAIRRDIGALRPVLSAEFSHQLGPLEPGVLETLAAWEAEEYAALDRLPGLLDRGIAPVPGTQLWAAPPEHAAGRGYADLRAGFRRGDGGWQWIFLVRDGR